MSVTRNGESERANILKANRERIVKTISPERIFFTRLLLAPSLFSCGIVKCTKFKKKEVPLLEGSKKKKTKCYTKSLTKNPAEKKNFCRSIIKIALRLNETKMIAGKIVG